MTDDACPRQVGEDAEDTAVDSIRPFAAERTTRTGSVGDGADRDTVVLDHERVDEEGGRNEAGDRGNHKHTSASREPDGDSVSPSRKCRSPLHLK